MIGIQILTLFENICPVLKEQTTDVMNITVNVLKIKDKKNYNYILFSKADAYLANINN